MLHSEISPFSGVFASIDRVPPACVPVMRRANGRFRPPGTFGQPVVRTFVTVRRRAGADGLAWAGALVPGAHDRPMPTVTEREGADDGDADAGHGRQHH